jgi:hypothetical protein
MAYSRNVLTPRSSDLPEASARPSVDVPRRAKDSTADADFPDIYTDSLTVSVGAYGVAFSLFLSDPLADEPYARTVGRVRMSVDLAKALNTLLAQSLAKLPSPSVSQPDDERADE